MCMYLLHVHAEVIKQYIYHALLSGQIIASVLLPLLLFAQLL